MHWGMGLAAWLTAGAALAHDPTFGIGPHVLFKGGVEIHMGLEAVVAGDARENEVAVDVTDRLTGDRAAGLALPRVDPDPAGTGTQPRSVPGPGRAPAEGPSATHGRS